MAGKKLEKLYTLRGKINGIHKSFTKGELTVVRFDLVDSDGKVVPAMANKISVPYILAAKEAGSEIRVKGHYRSFPEKNARGFFKPVQRIEIIFVERVPEEVLA